MATKPKVRSKYDILPPEAWIYYRTHPVEFVEDMILAPQSAKRGKHLFLSDHQKKALNDIVTKKRVAISSGRGVGKAQSHDTPTPTPNGIVRFGDLKVGDKIFGSDGNPTTVTGVFERGVMDVYLITFDDGSTVKCSGDHLWTVKDRQCRRKNLGWKTVSTKEIIESGVKRPAGIGRWDRNFEIKTLSGPVQYEHRHVDADPYVVGVWLGDGSVGSGTITNVDDDVLNIVASRYTLTKRKDPIQHGILGLSKHLRELGVFECRSHEKFIPDVLKYNSVDVRLEVLRGLLDTDGTVSKDGSVSYGSTSKRLCDDVIEVARSLGLKVNSDWSVKKTFYKDKNGDKVHCKDFYRCTITASPEVRLFNLSRKQNRINKNIQFRYYGKKWIESIERIEDDNVRCISVSAEDQLYVTENFVVTHNTAFDAYASIWFTSCFEESQVVLTSPSAKQLSSGLWKEIQLWLVGSHLQDMYEITSEKIYVNEQVMTGSFGSFIEKRTASKENPEALSGIHNTFLLVIIDEASRVHDDNIRSLVNTLTSGDWNKVVMTSNPTRTTGYYRDSMLEDRARLWTKHFWTAIDSPFVDEDQIEDMKQRYGVSHPIYKVDVLGEFCDVGEDTFFEYADVVSAFERDYKPSKNDAIEIGVDVARFGSDNSVLFWRHGYKVYPPVVLSKTSIVETSDAVKELVTKIRIQTKIEDKIRVKIDGGGLGSGLVDILATDRLHNIEVVECNFGARGDDRHQNEASLMYGQLRDCLPYISLPDEAEMGNPHAFKSLREELATRGVRYDTGKIALEQKSEYKRRIGRSPDLADALALCFFNKKNVRTFIPDFDSQSKEFILEKPSYLGGLEHFVSVHYSATRIASVVYVYWGAGTLYIFDEGVTVDNVARVASELRAKSPVKPTKILGNHRCFGSPSEDIRAQLRRQGISLRENFRYDELGAIELLNYLVSSKNVKIVKKCDQTIRQLDRWHVDLKPKELEDEYGLCYAILNIVSELRDRIKPKVRQLKQSEPYASKETTANAHSIHTKALLW